MTHQALPTKWEAREELREKGQFWTPGWVAEAMVAYVANGNAHDIFDPAVGAGAFFHAAKSIEPDIGRKLGLSGNEVDSSALLQAVAGGLQQCDLKDVSLQDFTTFKPPAPLSAIVANPPYIRHHRLGRETKERLRALSSNILGFVLDGRAGYHVYFLIHALNLLAEHGRLAFIIPADTFEGVFASKLWRWITAHYRLEAVVTFEPGASPFPRVDTNAVVVLLKKSSPQETFRWARVGTPSTTDLKRWVLSDFQITDFKSFSVVNRTIAEATVTGLSRPPQQTLYEGPVLGDYAKVLRGIATGANEFFFLTHSQVEEMGIPDRYLLPSVGRTRDVDSEIITIETLQSLEAKGRPTLLLSIDGSAEENLPDALREYLAQGQARGLHERALIKTRRPWYKMETRDVPPIIFAYLGRRNVRFIRNKAGVVPLTGFLCIYPRYRDEVFIEKLWEVLRHPETVENLARVGKSYGEGAIKVEPRSLERLPLPEDAMKNAGLPMTRLFPFTS